MRLMQIQLSQAEAGAETYFEKVASAFAQDKSITQRLVIEALPSREARLQAANVEFDTLPMGAISRPLFYHWKLKQAVLKFNPDIIFTWQNRASKYCPQTGAPIVGRLGGYYYLAKYSKCEHLVVNTPDLVRHVVEHNWDPNRVTMISNFGELPASLQVPQQIPGIPNDHTVLLALGRLHEKKAHDTLIKAMPYIPRATLLIAGSGELEKELKDLSSDLGVADRVKFLGLRKDIHNLFQRADICVFPSRFEPLGNVILEAWATETPLVSAASQGPSWLVEHETNGLLFPVDDHKACAKEVNRLIMNDGSLREKIVANGLKKFREQHSMDVIINQYKTLFQKLLTLKKTQV